MSPPLVFAAAVLAAAPSAAVGTPVPDRAAIEAALNELEVCRGLSTPDCPPPHRRYTVHRAKCVPIPPEDGLRAVACRVDETLTYADPRHETTRFRDSCVRFGMRNGSEISPAWVVLQIRDRRCEIPSALTSNPNRTPKRRDLERAILGRYGCYDPDGITHCPPDPNQVAVEAFRCRPIGHGDEGRARVACRVTGTVGYSGLLNDIRLQNECVRLDRITRADESPAYWVAIYVPDQVRCEIR